MRVAPQVVLTEDQERTLRQWARVRSLPARQVERARVVLLAAAGRQDLEIAFEVGISNQKAARWRNVSWKWAWLDWKRMHPAPGAANHHAPTSSSWRNMLERFFRDLTQNRLRRGIFVMSRS